PRPAPITVPTPGRIDPTSPPTMAPERALPCRRTSSLGGVGDTGGVGVFGVSSVILLPLSFSTYFPPITRRQRFPLFLRYSRWWRRRPFSLPTEKRSR